MTSSSGAGEAQGEPEISYHRRSWQTDQKHMGTHQRATQDAGSRPHRPQLGPFEHEKEHQEKRIVSL